MGCAGSRSQVEPNTICAYFPKSGYTRADAVTWAVMHKMIAYQVIEGGDHWQVRQRDASGAPTRVVDAGNGVRLLIEEQRK